jgi:hypothetical protein
MGCILMVGLERWLQTLMVLLLLLSLLLLRLVLA